MSKLDRCRMCGKIICECDTAIDQLRAENERLFKQVSARDFTIKCLLMDIEYEQQDNERLQQALAKVKQCTNTEQENSTQPD